MEVKFYRCSHCGRIAAVTDGSGAPVCCGEPMQELTPNTTDAAVEKHVPVVTVAGNTVTVTVGSVPHPMTPEHSISGIYLVTSKGVQSKNLTPGSEPVAVFTLADGETPVSAFAYCNLHGLWKADI